MEANFLARVMLIYAYIACGRCDTSADGARLPPTVEIPSLGTIQGRESKSHFSGRVIYEYLGINYAKPPSGERRFKAPEAFGPWEGIYQASKMRQRCPQVDVEYYPPPLSEELDVKDDIEDCLVVNVFTTYMNGRNRNKNQPVMFYVHGGSFCQGSTYDFYPDFLLEKDIILVVPQYRLGPLGFLYLNTTEVPGNVAMLDILLALRWVKAHIEHFGGDPSKITVVGQSAGTGLLTSLLISPLVEKGLFDKMIVQSGSILGLWAIDPKPLDSAVRIAAIAGCPTDNLEEMTKCFKKLPPLDLARAHAKFLDTDVEHGGGGHRVNGLVVQSPGEGSYLVKHPVQAFAEGSFARVPIMGGVTRDEGSSFLASFYDQHKLKNGVDPGYLQRNITKDIITFFGYEDKYGISADLAHGVYFVGKESQTWKGAMPALQDLCGVLLLKQPTFNFLRMLSYGNDVYVYSFNFYGNISRVRWTDPQWNSKYPFPAGIAHSDELGYIFPWKRSTYTERELKMVRLMTNFWSNFITCGTPVLPEDDIKWPKMSTAYGPYLRILDVPELRESFFDEYIVAMTEGFHEQRNDPENSTLE